MMALKRFFSAVLACAVSALAVLSCGACEPSYGVDFVLQVDHNKAPVVLHLTDPQIIEEEDALKEQKCYRYIRETVQTTNPDLILVTGDLVYGKYDLHGDALVELIAFMESLETPWAPVFGNHDNESPMGVAWQCERLEEAEYCLFKRGNLSSGNGNYTVGIVQGGSLKRVFFMMDSGGCVNMSALSMRDGGVLANNGFEDEQFAWLDQTAGQIRSKNAQTKMSVAFHIQTQDFASAYAQYGFGDILTPLPIYIDRLAEKREGDFGLLVRQMKGPWDYSSSLLSIMVEHGFDSVFVGHEHCNSASVVWNGIRYQYGQKSSEYDRKNFLQQDGTVIGAYNADLPPLIGGTVLPLSKDSGEIVEPYIYLCDTWSSFDWTAVDTD